MRYTAVAGSDIGSRNSVNQDTFLVKTAHTNLGNVCIALICDGLGGLQEGEKASQTVAALFNDWFTKKFRNIPDKLVDKVILDSSIEGLLNRANSILIKYSSEKNIKLGTTASIIIIINENYFTYHVGDTRIYKYDNKLVQLTQDHTLAAAKVRNGQLTKEEAKISHEKNLLLQCIGTGSLLEIHKTEGSCSSEDIFLLCSDGLYNKLEDWEIANVLNNMKNVDVGLMQNGIDYIVNTVKSRGETDNISGLIVRLK